MRRLLIVSSLGICFSFGASAAPITWVLSGVTFSDGTSGTGSFVFDASTVNYSSILVQTENFGFFAGQTYTELVPAVTPTASNVLITTGVFGNYDGVPALNLIFGSPLTDAGGTIDLVLALEANCGNPTCTSPGTTRRTLLSGSVTAVPEAASVAHLTPTLGILALGL
jgi:hypothetical protein